MNLTFKQIELYNFGSYEHATVNLQNKGFCAVKGRNHYKKDCSLSNGSGKSMLWSAICFALTGETIKGIKTQLKNQLNDSTDCWVKLTLAVDKDEYIITRFIAPKSDLTIIKNNTDISGKGIRESEKKLGEVLPDLTKDLISSTIIIGQGMPNKFSSFSPVGRKELLEKLTKSEYMIEEIKTRLTGRQADLTKQMRELEDSLLLKNQSLTTKQTELEKNQKELSQMVSPDYKAEIKQSEEQIISIEKDIKEANESLNKLEKEVTDLNEQLISLGNNKTSNYTVLNENYSKATLNLNQEKTDLEIKVSTLTTEITKLKSIKDICPTCGQKIQGIEKPDTTEKEKQLQELQELLLLKQTELNTKKIAYNNYVAEIEAKFTNDTASLRNKLAETRKAVNIEKDNINDYTHYLNTEKAKLDRLKYEQANFNNYFNTLKETIKKLIEETTALQTDLDNLTKAKIDLQQHVDVIKKIDTLVKRDFRGYLLINVIKLLDKKAKEYSEIVYGTTDLNIYLDGNALDITYCGKNFDNLSGGEQQRIDLILQFAIRDMLSIYLNYGSNILVLDEIFDNLDKVATNKVLELITSKLKDVESVFIISHHSDSLNISYDYEINVIKNENGISEVIE